MKAWEAIFSCPFHQHRSQSRDWRALLEEFLKQSLGLPEWNSPHRIERESHCSPPWGPSILKLLPEGPCGGLREHAEPAFTDASFGSWTVLPPKNSPELLRLGQERGWSLPRPCLSHWCQGPWDFLRVVSSPGKV
ncbi:hypothetical protein P7K49_016494 [Saguinus oedipus]|uniref:Uncharacterized protein n=1 Tax=Saguinus oedipus TaxID=9490 RepID=A0ABQ9VD19_SAGOE|nr:hypothetical protein P7K49_016494 [Saguinus oedipus]